MFYEYSRHQLCYKNQFAVPLLLFSNKGLKTTVHCKKIRLPDYPQFTRSVREDEKFFFFVSFYKDINSKSEISLIFHIMDNLWQEKLGSTINQQKNSPFCHTSADNCSLDALGGCMSADPRNLHQDNQSTKLTSLMYSFTFSK